MIQIIGLRKGSKGTYQAFYDRKWGATTIRDLFASLPKILAQIPEVERYNLFYTVHECDDKSAQPRVFQRTNTIVFDIDDLPTEIEPTKYLDIVLKVLKIPEGESIGFVRSGHGLHFILCLDYYVSDQGFFQEMRPHYVELVGQINDALAKAQLPGKCDPAVFDQARIMRLPGTKNIKPDMPSVECVALQTNISLLNWRIGGTSNLGHLPKLEDAIPEKLWNKVSAYVDKNAILSGCEFLKHCRDDAETLSEPEWYAAMGIIARLPNGREIAHSYSKPYFGYTYEGTEKKIAQALARSLPQNCKTINGLWRKCAETCQYWGRVNNPTSIVGEDFIKTSKTGFHSVYEQNGTLKVGKPHFEDLRKYFERENTYKSVGSIIHIWKNTHWGTKEKNSLKEYAYLKFEPKVLDYVKNEFYNLLVCSNVSDQDWFIQQSLGKINFQNGTLLLLENKFEPHSPDFGMTYILPYAYEADATAPLFEKFMLEIMEGDAELVEFLLEFMGYCVSGDTCWAHKALMLYGGGRNGKSVLLDVMKALVGQNNWSSVMLDELDDDNRRYMLLNKLFNIGEETPDESMLDSSVFKTLVAGGSMTAKKLYADVFSFTNRTKLIFASNDIPSVKNLGVSMLQRLMIVPFNAEFTPEAGNQDVKLYDKLITELPGIMNLVVSAYKRLKARGKFLIPPKVSAMSDVLKSHNDNVHLFLREIVEVGKHTDDSQIGKRDLYDGYKIFCGQHGYRPLSDIKFFARLRKQISHFNERETRPRFEGSNRNKHIRGISWREGIDNQYLTGEKQWQNL